MYTSFGESCARHLGKAAVLAWACCMLSCIDISVTHASLFHSSNEPSVDIRVVGSAGPIWVGDKFVAEDQFGLPSIQIYETFKDHGKGGPLWADVEVKVTVRHSSNHGGGWGWGDWGSGWGSGGSSWGDWGNNNNGDSGCGSGGSGWGGGFGWGGWGDSGCDTSDPGNGDPNDNGSTWGDWGYGDSGWGDWGWGDWGWDGWDWGNDDPPADPNFSAESLIIGIDKFVKNKTSSHWFDFRIGLGTGIGDDFEPSGPEDGLYIVSDPAPKEVTSFYDDDLPSMGPESSNGFEIDRLQWYADGQSSPGQGYEDKSIFWFGVHIPDNMFYEDYHDPDVWHAKFTIRQHTGIPEPASGIMMLMLSSAMMLRRKK